MSLNVRVTDAFRARNYATLMPLPEPYSALFYLSMQTPLRQNGDFHKMLLESHMLQPPLQACPLI